MVNLHLLHYLCISNLITNTLRKQLSLLKRFYVKRIKGVKNEADIYITPAFPKLIYVLDEHNVTPDSPYYYLTELAAQCTAKRMYPDYISAKK